MSLLSLPTELVDAVLSFVSDTPTLLALTLTCRRLRHTADACLFRSITFKGLPGIAKYTAALEHSEERRRAVEYVHIVPYITREEPDRMLELLGNVKVRGLRIECPLIKWVNGSVIADWWEKWVGELVRRMDVVGTAIGGSAFDRLTSCKSRCTWFSSPMAYMFFKNTCLPKSESRFTPTATGACTTTGISFTPSSSHLPSATSTYPAPLSSTFHPCPPYPEGRPPSTPSSLKDARPNPLHSSTSCPFPSPLPTSFSSPSPPVFPVPSTPPASPTPSPPQQFSPLYPNKPTPYSTSVTNTLSLPPAPSPSSSTTSPPSPPPFRKLNPPVSALSVSSTRSTSTTAQGSSPLFSLRPSPRPLSKSSASQA